MTPLGQAIQDYLALRRRLGFKLRDAGLCLVKFAAFMEARDAPHITTALDIRSGASDLLDGGGNNDTLLGDDGDTLLGGDGTDYFRACAWPFFRPWWAFCPCPAVRCSPPRWCATWPTAWGTTPAQRPAATQAMMAWYDPKTL